jgi:hypothetical protein
MLLYHGVWVFPVALLGAIIGLQKRDPITILAVGWLALILEFSTLGILESLAPGLVAPLLRYDYPLSLAWHGPIIPYAILGGIGLLWLWERWGGGALGVWLRRQVYAILAILIALTLGILILNAQILEFSKGRVGFFGAFSSAADVQAMQWLKANTSPDSRILNYPGTQFDNSHESDWVPVIAERDSVYYRWQPFFRGNAASLDEQAQLRAFWENPADPANVDLLKAAGIDYVIVPEVVNNPASIQAMFRWRAPVALIEMRSRVADAPYLKRVFESDGAEVYALIVENAR